MAIFIYKYSEAPPPITSYPRSPSPLQVADEGFVIHACPAKRAAIDEAKQRRESLDALFTAAVAGENNPNGPLHILQRLKPPEKKDVPVDYLEYDPFYDLFGWYLNQQTYAKMMAKNTWFKSHSDHDYCMRVLKMTFSEYLTAVLTGGIGIPVPNTPAAALAEEVHRRWIAEEVAQQIDLTLPLAA